MFIWAAKFEFKNVIPTFGPWQTKDLWFHNSMGT